MLVQCAIQVGALLERHHLPRLPRMEIAQIVNLLDVIRSPPFNGRGRDGQQLVGGLPHGRNHHHRPPSLARPHDGGHALDGGRRFHRRPAEFHHNHRSACPACHPIRAATLSEPRPQGAVL